MNNKFLVLFLMFIFVLSISAVNAQDSIESEVGICDIQKDQLTLENYQTDEIGNFSELNDEIGKIVTGGNFTLKKDYAYTSNDSGFMSGIKITQDNIVIDGNGHTIDGAGQARIFDIFSNNVTLKNINFINGYSSENGGAIYVENDFSNCMIDSTFINNSAYNGGAIFFRGAVTDVTINGYFEGNKAERAAGAIYVGGKSINNTISAEFYNNSANAASGGAIFFYKLAENNLFESVFRYNYGSYGAGIFFYGKANNNRFNSDFRFNVAKSCGGALFFYNTTNNNNFSGYFINNSALGKVDVENGNGGAITFKFTSCNSVFTCDFVNNTAVLYGGGVNYRQTSYNITFNSNFINNKAKYGGGVNFFETFENVVFNGKFIGNVADYGGAIATENGTIENTSFWNNSATQMGGAIYFGGDGIVNNCEFNGNSFISDYGDGGAIYFNAEGTVSDCNFTNNRARTGGALYLKGDNIKLSKSIFFENSARDSGGAVYLSGSNAKFDNVNFTGNAAYKGSAIYKTSDALNFNVTNVIFGRNRANSSNIVIEVEGNESYAPTNRVIVNVYLEGNDNIANAIWNDGGVETIRLGNVSCEFSQDGNGRRLLRFNENYLQNPTDGFVDDSTMWQSPHERPVEDAQLLDILITNEDGTVTLYNLTDGTVHNSNPKRTNLLLMADDSDLLVTDVDGKITVELENLKEGKYSVKSKHAGDEYYDELAEDTTFVIHDLAVVLNVTVTANVDVAYNNTLVNFTCIVKNVGLGNATEVILTDSLPDTLIYLNWGIINGNGATIIGKTLDNGVELNISNITSGNFVSIWIEALTNGVGDLSNNVTVYCKENYTKVNGSGTLSVIPEVVPPANSDNKTTIKHIDIENIKNKSATGNPILALLMVLSVLGITIRRK